MIYVRDLHKQFRIPLRKTGRLAVFRSLLSRQYTIKNAVDGITFTIEQGEMVGYVGPNGAGKSTTIKMLTGILVPTSGEIRVWGMDPHRQRKQYVSHIGAMFGQKTQLWWDVPVIESFLLLKEIYKIPTPTYKANLARFDDILELGKFYHTPVRQLSLGQRIRADLAAALLHNPKMLFLDEPTIGVDVLAKERFRSFIHELNQEQQITVMLTTHDMSDIEKLCSRILMIDHGRIIYDGSVADIKEHFTPYRVLVADLAEGIDRIEVDRAEQIKRENNRVYLRFSRKQVSASELIVQLAEKYPVRDISIQEPEIEMVIREIYDRSTNSESQSSEQTRHW